MGKQEKWGVALWESGRDGRSCICSSDDVTVMWTHKHSSSFFFYENIDSNTQKASDNATGHLDNHEISHTWHVDDEWKHEVCHSMFVFNVSPPDGSSQLNHPASTYIYIYIFLCDIMVCYGWYNNDGKWGCHTSCRWAEKTKSRSDKKTREHTHTITWCVCVSGPRWETVKRGGLWRGMRVLGRKRHKEENVLFQQP